jgi:hypothetical protein
MLAASGALGSDVCPAPNTPAEVDEQPAMRGISATYVTKTCISMMMTSALGLQMAYRLVS